MTANRAGTDRPASIARLRVARFKQEKAGRKGTRHFDEFEVPVEAGDTILDALLRVRATQDPSLVVRHACMRGSCGACGVRVDGREVLACDTPAPATTRAPTTGAATTRPTTIEPITGQRPIADLAVDMVDFQLRMNEVDRPLVRRAEPDATATAAEPPEGVRAYTRFEDCIECGLCLAACPVASADRQYIGPAALAAAARVVAEPRGRDLGPVLALAKEPDSVWRCRDAMECSAVCPAGVEPATAIITLRRRIAGRH